MNTHEGKGYKQVYQILILLVTGYAKSNSLNMHAQLSRGARSLKLGLSTSLSHL